MITGGAGFIGSAVVRQYIAETDAVIVNVDKLTYAGNLGSLGPARLDPRHVLEQVDICDRNEITRLVRKHRPTGIIHLAAESHVDRSIDAADQFMMTNIIGTFNLLEVALAYWNKLKGNARQQFRFHHVSTDEVYGDLGPDDPAFIESSPYKPSSPYAASKASSDHLVRAWHRTHGLPIVMSNCSNNYGPFQYPEKLIPLMIVNGLKSRPLPVYGAGTNVRDWLYVEDHASALRLIYSKGRIGRTYNIGGRMELTNLEVVRSLCSLLDELAPSAHGPHDRLISFVTDRPGHDRRYAINDERLSSELGWKPNENFESGLRKTVMWYLENDAWLDDLRRRHPGQLAQDRLGHSRRNNEAIADES